MLFKLCHRGMYENYIVIKIKLLYDLKLESIDQILKAHQ